MDGNRWLIRATIAAKEKMMVDAAGTPAGQLNPLETMRRLRAAGCEPDLAEAIADELFALSAAAARTRPATKADFVRFEGRLDSMVSTLRAEIRADLNAAVVKVIAAQIVTAGALFAAVAALIAAIRFSG